VKELVISFTKPGKEFPRLKIISGQIETVNHAGIPGLTISKDLKWNQHITNIFSSEAITPNAIEQLVDHTVSHLKITADKTIPTRVFKPVRKHYWNPTLTSLNREVKTCWRKWLYEGEPRDSNNQFFKDYKKAKYNFRKAQRQAIHEDEVNGEIGEPT
ncbi:Hypothetical predicted protein, partial [Paramuricea clavata]